MEIWKHIFCKLLSMSSVSTIHQYQVSISMFSYLIHTALLNLCLQTSIPINCYFFISDTYQPVTLLLLPMYHIFATQVAMRMFRACHKFVVMPQFSADNLINALEKYQVIWSQIKAKWHYIKIKAPGGILQTLFV